MLFSSSAVPVSPVSLFRGGLRFEPLEARCLLSASQPVDLAIALVAEVETGGDTPVHFSLLAGPIVESPTEGVSVEMVGATHLSGEKPELTIAATSSPVTDVVTTEAVPAPQPLAVPPDDSVDPFVDCPGLDEEFCLPDKIELVSLVRQKRAEKGSELNGTSAFAATSYGNQTAPRVLRAHSIEEVTYRLDLD